MWFISIISKIRMYGIALLAVLLVSLVATGLIYNKGRRDEKESQATKTLVETVVKHETERKVFKKVRDYSFDDVLDLNDRMYQKDRD